MINRVGLTGAVKNLSKDQPNLGKIIDSISELDSKILVGRVTDIILDETHPKFEEYGGWSGLGTVFYELIDYTSNSNSNIARPFSPQIKNYPLIKELILLFSLPDNQIGTKTSSTSYYYLNSINLWNTPHHNAYPNYLSQLGENNIKSYLDTTQGSNNIISNEPQEINLNSPYTSAASKFIEKDNIHPLLSFNGDNLFEGRFGNSIRLGNTNKTDSKFSNIWSENGESGDPITIIRNGQPKDVSNEGWLPITEDINKDLSSMWMTSFQKIPIGWEGKFGVFSSKSKPSILSQYKDPQIIFNSSRIILNSTTSDILISSDKSTSISARYVNIDSNNLYVDSENVKLGNTNATEPIILGNIFLGMFDQLLQTLDTLLVVLERDQAYPGGVATPNELLNITATNSRQIISSLKNNLENAKSKISKTV